ncbi:MAG: ACP S-malonyltransferase [Microbacteriaceae bacterium]|nr:ACP S-malonyltransferase [Microbacteriaceae bacterium]
MIIIACPGQGSQTPGFLEPWLADETARTWLAEVSSQIGCDLIKHGTESDADTIRATNIAQPLIVAAGILTVDAFNRALDELAPETAAAIREKIVFAGHSVGEITAAYAAGVFDSKTALRFVADRANAMQECATAQSTGMAAVLGGETAEVETHLASLDLAPANYNGAGQIVAAGEHENLDKLAAAPLEKTRVIKLQVAGAFHTEFMAPARDALAANREKYASSDPHSPLYTNFDGSTVADGNKYVDLLVAQVASPVRWDLCMEKMLAAGADTLIEAAPAGALAGLARRGMPGVTAHKISSPDDVKSVVATLAAAVKEG